MSIAPQAELFGGHMPRLLVVEDDPLVRTVCVRLLRLRHYQVDQAENGLQALDNLAQTSYDIVLTDLSMPSLNGLGLLRHIKEHFPDTDVIMITAFGSIDTAKQALKLGAFDYLTKPLELDDLARVVQTCLEMRELRRLRHERETLSEMVSLLELSRTISARLDLEAQTDEFLTQLSRRFRPSRVALSLLDPDDQQLTLVAQRGFSHESHLPRSVRLPVAELPESQLLAAHSMLVEQAESRQQRLQVLRMQERPVGVLQMSWDSDTPSLSAGDAQLFEVFAASMAVALENGRLYSKLKQQNLRTITALATAIDARDPYTRGHSEQVMRYAVRLAQRIGMSEAAIERLRYAALLHDVGKIGVPDAILRKPSRLTDAEFEIMKQHPIIGARIVGSVLGEVCDAILHHHEHWDGSGYPDRLVGEAIPLEARVIAVADAFDAMTSDRAYRRAMSPDEAIAILVSGRHQQWQAELVDSFVELLAQEGAELLASKDRAVQEAALDLPMPFKT